MTLALTQVDALALAMLAVLALSFGCVLLIVAAIYRRGKAAGCEVEKLIEEVADAERERQNAGPPGDAAPRAPWEREADWWKG